MTDTIFNSSLALPQVNPAIAPQPLCPSNLPLVLLPVRLETRFFKLTTGETQLRIRVYPDKIHLDTHELDLTTDERTWGMLYWQQDWAAGPDMAARGDAWRSLAKRFGATRAAWIARQLRPTNIAQRPTTVAGQTSTAAPIFPQLPPVGPGGENPWRHAPQARLLPDHWTAIVHSAGQVAVSANGLTIRRPLAVGPDPQAPPFDARTAGQVMLGNALPIDTGMKWMVDFDEAEAAGMALRMTLPPAVVAAGIDSLVVFGVSKAASPADTAAQLADLFDAHSYTDGLEFLRFGTPTNNTDDQRAGFSSEDPDHTVSFHNEVVIDQNKTPNAHRLGAAIGLPPARVGPTLGHLGASDLDHDLDFRSMNTALWPVGWGYFLTNMVGPETGMSTASVDWARGHFLSYVRAGGPFPALRFSRQPYGVLPVTSLDLWAPGAGEAVATQEAWLKTLLVNMRDKVWRPVVGQVARVGLRQSPPDPDSDLADVMAVDGVSHGHFARRVVGRQYVQHLYAIAGQSFAGIGEAQDAASAKLLDLLSLPPNPVKPGPPSDPTKRPRAAKAFYEPQALAVTAPLVLPADVSPTQMLQPNYIADLLNTSSIATLASQARNSSLLEALLRQAMLHEIATAAARILATPPNGNLAALWRDAELVDLVDAPIANFTVQTPPGTLHWKRQLDAPLPPPFTGAPTIRGYLEGLKTFTDPAVASLGEFRAGLDHLQGLDTESLQHLMQGTLDLSAHRLDAWITSFATKRLALMTGAASGGQYVGAYGWVENLKPAPDRTPIADTALPAGEPGPLFPYANDTGFIHAPSMTHASAAALLRNAHLGPLGKPGPDDPFAIDLSSRRVREASRLLDGVRQGQPLGALLGYRLERNLHDLQHSNLIAPLRAAAPLAVRARESNPPPVDAVAANNVVDGLLLTQRWQAGGDAFLITALPQATDAERAAAKVEIAALLDDIDGLGDSLTAEAAYQMARGNTSRLGATLSAIAQGDAPPPDLEVAQIPRTGTALTHRVVVGIGVSTTSVAGWADASTSVLANNETRLNAWVGGLLGDPRKVRCTVELPIAGATPTVQALAFPLSELGLTPLDFIYGIDDSAASSQSIGSLSHVEQLVLYTAQRRTGGFGAQGNLRLQHARPTNLAAGETTLFDLLEQGRAIRRLLENARGARPDDLGPPERPGQGVIDLADLQTRVQRGEDALGVIQKALQAKVAGGTATSADALRSDLLALAAYGLRPATPCVAVGDTPDNRSDLLRQATALLKAVGPRLDQAAAARTQPPATDQRQRCAQLLEYGRAVFGAKFVMLPQFTCDAARSVELKAALAASTAQQGGDPLAVHAWFARSAQVREPVARLAACLRGAEVLGAGARLSLSVAQLPFNASERWVGLAPLPRTQLPQSKLSIAMQSAVPPDPATPLTGLFVDEWVEVVPSSSETTAITFQFDPPNAMAPQSILVAVPPVPGQDWTTETLRTVLMETLDLAKLRAVDGSLLGAAAQYLPGLYVPFNINGDAVSTDFAALTQ